MDAAPAASPSAAGESGRDGRGASLGEIEALYARGRVRFVGVAARIVGDAHEANDVVQEAFAQAVRARGSFRGAGSLEAWLWRLVVNAARSDRRRRRDLPLEFRPVDAASDGDAPAPADAVREALVALPERQRLVLFLRYYADLDYRAIAETLQIEVGTVGSTLNQAQAALKVRLTEAGSR